jgi:hypothetical protein
MKWMGGWTTADWDNTSKYDTEIIRELILEEVEQLKALREKDGDYAVLPDAADKETVKADEVGDKPVKYITKKGEVVKRAPILAGDVALDEIFGVPPRRQKKADD